MKNKLGSWAVSQDRLHEVLDYDPETGVFIWKMRIGRKGASTLGKRAGHIEPNGYRNIRIDGKWYLAQKLAWFYMKGEWPERMLRFQNRDKDDCAIGNLGFGEFHYSTAEGRRAYDRAHIKRNPGYHRALNLRRDFGITLDQYQTIFVAQGGVCACCKQPERDTRSGKTKWLAVDHNHETGSVRGLLCSACNTGIGKFGDDPDRLEVAAAYLRSHAASEATNIIPLNARGRRNLSA